ncbi:MAG: DUF5671 domain-containing protein [Candidatus Saccharibacteria bacterium]|nr:DUF5671 domain-containing protein [Candidatus Saccharibacteria bacterium]
MHDQNQVPPSNDGQVAAAPSVRPQSVSAPMQGSMRSELSKSANSNNKESVPVVKVWSIRGVEYAIMTFMLWAIAVAVNWVLVALVNGSTGFVALSAPLALLIVSLPVFALFFIRLKKAELADPSLRAESSKRRFTQITQIISFAVIFFALLGIVASLLAAIGGESDDLGKTIASAFMFVLVWGGMFTYYWFDEHRMSR